MKTLLRKCPKCREYSLEEICPRCGVKNEIPIPPRYSPDDRYGEYRRKLKMEKMAKG